MPRRVADTRSPAVAIIAPGGSVLSPASEKLVCNAIARAEAVPPPLGALVAATADWIGCVVQQPRENALRRARSERAAVTSITRVQVNAVYADRGTPRQRALRHLTVDEGMKLDRSGAVGEGSTTPKVRAAIDFARTTGGRANITELARGRDAVRGEAGTTITAEKA